MHQTAQRFVDALHHLHRSRDVEPLAAVFADDATLSKLGAQHERHGQDGARQFWQEYRDVFDAVEATFHDVVEDEGTTVLEWTSTGTLAGGRAFSYAGVSVLRRDGERVAGFRTYYDSAVFTLEPPGA